MRIFYVTNAEEKHLKPESFISKVIADGRVTIPKDMRKKKGIDEGDFVEVQLVRKISPSEPKGAES
jgi:AbrB family looped-hinge helix DNA binding protein